MRITLILLIILTSACSTLTPRQKRLNRIAELMAERKVERDEEWATRLAQAYDNGFTKDDVEALDAIVDKHEVRLRVLRAEYRDVYCDGSPFADKKVCHAFLDLPDTRKQAFLKAVAKLANKDFDEAKRRLTKLIEKVDEGPFQQYLYGLRESIQRRKDE